MGCEVNARQRKRMTRHETIVWGNVHNHMAAWAVEESRRYDQRSQALDDHLEVALDAADAAVVAMRRGAKP